MKPSGEPYRDLIKPSMAKFLRRRQAAAYVREKYNVPCSENWLAKLAVVGGGPTFRKCGRVPLYIEHDLDRWVIDRIGPKLSSTSEITPSQEFERYAVMEAAAKPVTEDH